MKRINVKLLTILVASTILTGICFYALYQFQMRRNTEKFLQQAMSYHEEGDLSNARKSLGRYIQYKPEDKEKMVTLAKWSKELFDDKYPKGELDQRQMSQIYGVIETAVRENTENKEMRDVAIDFFMSARIFSAVIPHIEARLMLADKDEDISKYLLQLSQLYPLAGGDNRERWVAILCEMIDLPLEKVGRRPSDFVSEKIPEDKTLVQCLLKTEASTHYPDNVDAYLGMASQLVGTLKRPELAENVINRMIEVNPNSPLAHLGRARYLRVLRKSTREAVMSANKALSLPLQDGDEKNRVLQETSDLFIAIGQYRPAKQILDNYAADNPDSPQPYLLYANWAKRQDKFDEAREYLDQGLEKHSGDTRLHRALLNLELDRDSSDGVAASLEFLRQQNKTPLLIDFYQARLDFVNGETIRSARELGRIGPDIVRMIPSLQPTVDRTLAKAYTRLGEHDKALEHYKKVLETDRDDRTFWGAVKSLQAMRQPQSAIKAYQDYGQLKLWETNGNERTLRTETLNEDYPFLVNCLELELLSQSASASTDWSFAEAIVNLIRNSPHVEDQQRYAVIANYYDIKGEPQRAAEIRKFMAAKHPDSVSIRLQTIQKLAATDPSAALSQLDQLGKQNDEQVVAVDQLRVGLLLQTNPADLKDRLLAIEKGSTKYGKADRASLLKELGRAFLAIQEAAESQRLLSMAVQAAPEDIDARMLVVKLALQRGDEVDAEIDEILELYGPDSAVLKWAQASKIISQHRRGLGNADSLEEANTLVRDGLAKRDSWSELYQLSAEIAMLRGDRSTAIGALEKAIKSGGKSPILRISLANMLVGAGRPELAKTLYESVNRRMWNTQTELNYFNVLSQLGKLPDEIAYNKESTDTYYHANIGRLALRDANYLKELNGDPERIRKRQLFAIERFKQSVRIEPTLIESWQLLVRALVEVGERDAAMKVISKAQLEIAEEKSHLFLAQTNEMVGNMAESYSHYKSHLRNHPDDVVALQGVATMLYTSGTDKSSESHVYIDRILNSKVFQQDEVRPRDREVLAWARRTKAKILSQSNTYHDFDTALSIIEQSQDENGTLPPEDLLLYGKLAASRNDGVSKNKAITRLEEVRNLGRRELTRDELVILAELYKMQGRWEDCSSIMNTLLGNTPNDMNLLAPWLAWLIEDDQVRLAEKWLENADKNSMAYVRAQAHIWVKKGETRKAIALLQPLLPKEFKTEEAKNRIVSLANHMEQMGEDDPRFFQIVEKIWRKYVQNNPGESLRLAVFLGRQKDTAKLDEAFQICQAAIQSGQAQQALQVAVAILRMNQDRIPVGSRQHELVKQWYDAEERANPDSAALAIQRSEFDGIIGDFDRAVSNLEKYRTDESVSPQQRAMANNNLAYILALQGKGQRALDLIDESVGILGPISDLLDTRAMANLAMGRTDEALDDLNKAITFGGESAFKLFHLALAEIQSGRGVAAKETLRKAKEMGLEMNQLNLLEQKQFKLVQTAVENVDEERTEPVSTVGA